MARAIPLAAGLAGVTLGIASAAAAFAHGHETGLAAKAATAGSQIAERRALTGNEIRKRLVGYLQTFERRNTRGVRLVLYQIFRPDGSYLFKCEGYRTRTRAWALCKGLTFNRAFNGWINGLWRIENNQLCLTPAVRTWRNKLCHTVYDDGGQIIVGKGIGNRPTLYPGPINVGSLSKIRCVGHLRDAKC